MEQTWRWFGPKDKVTLKDARQAGAEGIVSALHDLPLGAVWPLERIRERQAIISAAGLRWSVVESLDVTEAIKTRGPHCRRDTDAFIQSLRNLHTCGLRTVAYNLMPVFSWMRTHLRVPLANGGSTTRFDAIAFAAFDLYILGRADAEATWTEAICRSARAYFDALSAADRDALEATVLQGLPGGNGSYTLAEVRAGVDLYREVDTAALRANTAEFLRTVCPVAQELGMRLSVHPDDPPRPLLGLPRIASTTADFEFLLAQSPEEANGITFCTGALGARADNDLLAMVKQFGRRIWFAHLRSVERDPVLRGADGTPLIESFSEAAHLEGDADLVGVIGVLVKEERRRREAGDASALPFRPDHGQQLLNDAERGAQAGYPAIGRLRGLAELRGVLCATERLLPRS